MTRSILLSTVIAISSASSVGAATLSDVFSSFYVLGDSNSDFGNFGADGPPPPYFDRQFSNGPVWADLIDDQFETGNPDDIRTWNYAYGGAKVTETSDAPDFPTQLNLFGADLDPTVDDPLEGTPVLGDRPLVAVWFGANDIRAIYQDYLGAVDAAAVLGDAAQAQAVQAAKEAASLQAIEVGAIYGATLESASQAPAFNDLLALTTADASATPEYDDPVDAALLRELSVLFNDQLTTSLAKIETAGVNVFEVDIFQLQQEIGADPIAFGFDNIADPCLTFDANGANICSTPESYLFWDEVGHLSGAAHSALAGIVQETILADPASGVAPVPLPASLPMLGAGFALLGALRLRRKASNTTA